MNRILIILVINYFTVIYCSLFLERGIRFKNNIIFNVLFFGIKRKSIPYSVFLIQIFNVIVFFALIVFDNNCTYKSFVTFLNWFVVLEFIILIFISILLIIKEAFHKGLNINDVLIYLVTIILIFDTVGIIGISIFKDKERINSQNIIYENLSYHESEYNSTADLYYEIFDKNKQHSFRIRYDEIQFFDYEKFIEEVKTKDIITIEYIKKEKYNTILGIKKNDVSFFSSTPKEIIVLPFKSWHKWYLFSTPILIISVVILIIIKIKKIL